MNLFGVLFILMVLAAGLASGALGVLSRRKRAGAPGAAAFSITMLTLSVLCFGYVGSLLVSDLPVNLLLLKLRYIGLHILPVAWLCFALSYTDRQIRRRYILVLLVIPVLTILIAWTNEWHGWLWQEITIRQDGSGLWDVFAQRGPWFRVANWYGYILLFAATAILLRAFLKQGYIMYKGQTMALLFGVLFPWFGNVLFVAGFTTLDWLPVTFTIGAMSLFWGMRRYKLLDLAPVARDTVFQSMESGV
ncbi:MAG: hypothetical protein JXB47_15475, partial [Anaerolineae bacterium]|nr:hypothetical protein [Anaerolineae bacterium]